jgi:hypothetical protein
MTAQHIQTKQDDGASTTQRKMGVIGLAVLPIALAAYSNGGISSSAISSILSGVFPIGFTLLSWGLAVKLGLGLRK